MTSLATPLSFVISGWRQRRLISQLTHARIDARYRGSMLGGLWVAVLPLLMLGIYTFVFAVVFRARWGGPAAGGDMPFALIIFSGLILFGVFSECVNEAPGLMHANQNYIKQVTFPSETLAWVTLLAALWRSAVSLLILLAFYRVAIGWPPLTSLCIPLAMLPVSLLTLGFVWLVSSLGVFVRDLAQLISVFTSALLFLSPIFYPISRVPAPLQRYLRLNPFSTILESSRQSLFEGQPPDWVALAAVTAVAWGVAWAGYAWFMRTKGGFADVL
jgi:lipopolysaccharide transport system permease protein